MAIPVIIGKILTSVLASKASNSDSGSGLNAKSIIGSAIGGGEGVSAAGAASNAVSDVPVKKGLSLGELAKDKVNEIPGQMLDKATSGGGGELDTQPKSKAEFSTHEYSNNPNGTFYEQIKKMQDLQ